MEYELFGIEDEKNTIAIGNLNDEIMTIRDFVKNKRKHGYEYFRLIDRKGNMQKPLYFVNFYERSLRKYSISKYDDVNYERFVSPNQLVTTMTLDEDLI